MYIRIVSKNFKNLDSLKTNLLKENDYLIGKTNGINIQLKEAPLKSNSNIESILEFAEIYPTLKNEVESLENILLLKVEWEKGNADNQYLNILKFIDSLDLDIIYVFDEFSTQVFNHKLIKYHVNIDFPVKNELIFKIHAVGDESAIWMHTHGLNRFQIPEIEVSFLKKGIHLDTIFNAYENLIQTTVNNLIYDNKPLSFSHGIDYQINLIDSTLIDFKKLPFFENLDEDSIKNERLDEYEENKFLVYEENGKNKYFHENENKIFDYENGPMFYYHELETKKAEYYAAKSLEKFEHSFDPNYGVFLFKALFEDKKNQEYMWVRLNEIKKDYFIGILLNQPYYLKIKKDSIVTIKKEDIIDWIIYLEEFTITPSNAYIID